MRQGQPVVQGEQLAIAVQRRQVAADQVHVEGARAPPLPPHAIRGHFHLLGTAQPAVSVERRVLGDEHRVEERALLDAAPGRRLVDRGDRLHRVAEPVEHRLQPGQPVTEVGSDRQHYTSHWRHSSTAATPASSSRRASQRAPRGNHLTTSAAP